MQTLKVKKQVYVTGYDFGIQPTAVALCAHAQWDLFPKRNNASSSVSQQRGTVQR